MNNSSSVLIIKNDNLIYNYRFFKNLKKNLIVAPTIKADAYSLGFQKIFDLFYKYGCRYFFVATLEEGIKINKKSKNVKIYVLNGIENHKVNLFKKNNLIPIINSLEELNILNKTKIEFGVHIDTGLNRLGINYKEIPKKIFKNNNISIVISHLASADEIKNPFNKIQRQRFENIKNSFHNKKIFFSLANSNGSVLSNDYLYDLIRPGIGLYGGYNNNVKLKSKIKSVVQLKGKVLQIKKINKSEYIGYNQTYKTDKKVKVAVIGIGYADGISRELSNKGELYYKKNIYKIVGRISMDSLTIDISNSKNKIESGMYIDIINNKYGIENFAEKCNTISNEILTSIGKRVKRIYE